MPRIHRFIIDLDISIHNIDLIEVDIKTNNYEALEKKLKQLSAEEIDQINSAKEKFDDYLFFPVLRGYTNILQLLNQYKINLHTMEPSLIKLEGEINALHRAVVGGDKNLNTIQFLLDQGIDVNYQSKNAFLRRPIESLLIQPNNVPIHNSFMAFLKAGAEFDDFYYSENKDFIKACLGDNNSLVNVGTDEVPVYRLKQENGKAYATYQEKTFLAEQSYNLLMDIEPTVVPATKPVESKNKTRDAEINPTPSAAGLFSINNIINFTNPAINQNDLTDTALLKKQLYK